MKILCLGTGPFAVPTLRRLSAGPHQVVGVVTRPERGDPRRRKTPPPSPMRQAATDLGLSVSAPESINSEEGLALLQASGADLLMVCDYGQILKPAALAATPLGGINLHGSLLPRHRGAAPVHAAILSGDLETGVTVIHMTPGLDAGPVLAVRRTPIAAHENQLELETRLAELGVDAVLEAIDCLARWDRTSEIGTRQDASQVTSAPRLKKEQGRIDWSCSATELDRRIRGLQPWPGCDTTLVRQNSSEPLRVLIERAEPVSEPSATGLAVGTIVSADRHGILVQAGKNSVLKILKLKPEGKRSLEVSEFLNGTPVGPGDRFESPA